eukprot:6795744-Pyramimonas_sp.AAC.1
MAWHGAQHTRIEALIQILGWQEGQDRVKQAQDMRAIEIMLNVVAACGSATEAASKTALPMPGRGRPRVAD